MRPTRPSSPGTWFRRQADRWFDRTTVELIVLPALADLQRECDAAGGAMPLMRLRAYVSVWKVIAFCAAGTLTMEARPTLSLLAGRLAITVPIVTLIISAAGIPYLRTITEQLGIEAALRAAVLVLPGTLFGSLPLAFFVAVVSMTRMHARPSRRRLLPGVMAGAVSCVALSYALTLITPLTNRAFHDTLYRAISTSTEGVFMRVGSIENANDWGWRALVDKARHSPDKRLARVARASLHQRIAWPLGAISLGLLAVALANRARSGNRTFVAGIIGLVVYIASFYAGAVLALLDDGMLIGVWAPTLVTAALAALIWWLPVPGRSEALLR